jgi:hypothetical protein
MVYLSLHTKWDYEVYREYDSEVESGGQRKTTWWMMYIDRRFAGSGGESGSGRILAPGARHILCFTSPSNSEVRTRQGKHIGEASIPVIVYSWFLCSKHLAYSIYVEYEIRDPEDKKRTIKH